MFRGSQKKWSWLFLPLASACIALGYYRGRSGSENNPAAAVNLRPDMFELGEPVSEGEVVTANLELVNNSKDEFLLERVVGSCSCLNILIEGKDWYARNETMRIAPGDRKPIQVQWSTAGRFGVVQQAVTISGRAGTDAIECTSIISGLVVSGPRVLPPRIVVDAQSEVQSYSLGFFSGNESPDYSVVAFRASNPDSLKELELKNVAPHRVSPELIQNFDFTFVAVSEGKNHGREGHEYIEFTVLRRGEESSFRIPVVFRPTVSPAIRFFPSIVNIPSQAKGTRVVNVIFKDESTNWHIGKKPSFIQSATLQIEEDSAILRLDFDTSNPEIEHSSTEIELVRDSESHSLRLRVE